MILNAAPLAAQDPDDEKNSAIQPVTEESTQNNDESGKDDDANAKPRDIYNNALVALEKGDLDTAIEKFLKARDRASNDNELRFSAAYNLAFSYAKKADSLGNPNEMDAQNLNDVIENLRLSSAWFRDSVNQRSDNVDARKNLEIVLKQIQTVTDILNTKFNKLENQLDELIASQREIREGNRALADRIQMAGNSKEPLSFQSDFQSLAKIQRGILTQANLVAENAEEELAGIEGIAEDQRTQEQVYRAFQLKNANPLLEQARQQMSSARRQLRDLSMENALRYTTQSFYLLKQAREQLENPLQTLNAMIQDEAELVRLSTARMVLKNPENFVNETSAEGEIRPVPTWLNQDLLNETQNDVLTRSRWLTKFLEAVIEAPMQEAQPGQEAQHAEAEKQRQQMKDALPFMEAANEAMQDAKPKLITDDLQGALLDEQNAMEKLMDAAEQFADLKHLIERSYAQQLNISELAIPKLQEANEEGGAEIDLDKKVELLQKFTDKNITRLEKLQSLIQEEAAKSQQNADPNASPEQTQQAQQLFEMAENLRQTAVNANRELQNRLSDPEPDTLKAAEAAADAQGSPSDKILTWIEPAQQAQEAIEQLRMLFFSIVEHIAELARQQEKTMDQTGDAADENLKGESSLYMDPILDRERQHEAMAAALQEALQKQSEQAQSQEGNNSLDMAQKFAQAATELQAAAAAMRQATANLESDNPMFKEGMQSQQEAEEHLKAAIAILQPPQQQQQNQQQQEQQQEQQKKMSQQQSDKKLQQIRERETQRRKSKQRTGNMQPVDKDW